ncbi:hypothetical protein MBUL_00190 [Methylobacterium bullatum]|uniref:Uncharacterized protein n=1 Tax=Methylobacterium bullatum TaxID=570505 RepID=A0A679II01_9HYPH|nr:hypothetical protein MBUL_00190 [Methylobacterium bullatum]
MRRDGLPFLKGEDWGEEWSISGEVIHLTLSLSFQERGPAHRRPEDGASARWHVPLGVAIFLGCSVGLTPWRARS